jgi:hypothetical protein
MSALHPELAPPLALVRPTFTYERRRPELTDLHAAIRIGWPQLREAVQEETGTKLPKFVLKGFAGYLTCGQLPRGFARFRCGDCRKDILVAFSCNIRGLCPSCDGKRMVEEAEHITGAILPHVPYRQWVLTLPYALRYLLAWNAQLRSVVHQALMRAITKHYQRDAELQKRGEVRDSDLPGINSRPR